VLHSDIGNFISIKRCVDFKYRCILRLSTRRNSCLKCTWCHLENKPGLIMKTESAETTHNTATLYGV